MKTKVWLTGLILAAMVMMSFEAQAQNRTNDLLEMAVNAPAKYNYSGTILNLVWCGDEASSRKIKYYHSSTGENRWEFLDSQGSPGLIIIEGKERRWEVHPAENTVIISSILECCQEDLRVELSRLRENYMIEVKGSAEVAGRRSTILSLTPRHPASPGRVVWIDDQTGVVLRWEVFSGKGSLTEMGVFTEFRVEQELDENLFTYQPESSEKVRYHQHPDLPQEVVELQRRLGEVIRYPTDLPKGYQFSRGRVLSRYSHGDTVQLQFSDGLNSISVFQTFYPSSDFAGTRLKSATELTMENTEVFLIETTEGYVLSWSKGKTLFSIVGNVPIEEIRAMAHSLRN